MKARKLQIVVRKNIGAEFTHLLTKFSHPFLNFFLAQIFLQLALLPLLGHKKAIGTLAIQYLQNWICSYVALFKMLTDRQTRAFII